MLPRTKGSYSNMVLARNEELARGVSATTAPVLVNSSAEMLIVYVHAAFSLSYQCPLLSLSKVLAICYIST